MKKRLQIVFEHSCYILILSFLFTVKGSSQSVIFETGKITWEAGINVGPSFFLGDLGGNAGKGTRFIKDVNLQFTNIMKGVFVAAYPADWFGFRLALQTGSLEADDAAVTTKGVDELWRKQRNLDFRSNISEAYIAAEIFPLMMFPGIAESNPRMRPYGVIGIGMFHFNPQGSLTDASGNKTWYDLHPLRTEGQGMTEYPTSKPYSLTQYNIPMGAGIKYYLSDRFNVSTEVLYRKSFTDYIDDVSTDYIDPNLFDKYLSAQDAIIAKQIHDKMYGIVTPGVTRYAPGTMRGNKNQDDAYFSFLMKFGVRLGGIYDNDIQRNAARQLRCPAKF
ncbi:MAG TPA: DUF6089 family protein [Chitinophagaceae bacterium]|nr:DUF6089 family protein [Chitinophagaceae bacterium]